MRRWAIVLPIPSPMVITSSAMVTACQEWRQHPGSEENQLDGRWVVDAGIKKVLILTIKLFYEYRIEVLKLS